jgi:hypothetical protein
MSLSPRTEQDNKVHLSAPIPETAIHMVGDLRIFMKMTPSGSPHLNSEPKLAER